MFFWPAEAGKPRRRPDRPLFLLVLIIAQRPFHRFAAAGLGLAAAQVVAQGWARRSAFRSAGVLGGGFFSVMSIKVTMASSLVRL
ncbi:hypothetical protein D3874_20890 [Oleomonas cavernae]|uniref:Uncharacterized protein n=1 Tax=Oleomonas cavernae TaxID=2320859 RepID=A0A418WGN2_9PROT|nr:hypothetical protein D3874_20890 [Oleomonas cavernae]